MPHIDDCPWRTAWHDHLAPLLPTRGLEALKAALETGDKTLIQGRTTYPHPFEDLPPDTPIDGACALGFCVWKGHDLATVQAVFAGVQAVLLRSYETTAKTNISVHSFFTFVDHAPWKQVVELLLPEVTKTLAARAAE